jgi:hypothetical protein
MSVMTQKAANMATDRYYLMLKGKSVGPLTPAQLARVYQEGLINRHSRIRGEGRGEAIPLYRDGAVSRAVFGRRRHMQKLRGVIEERRGASLAGMAFSIVSALFAIVR